MSNEWERPQLPPPLFLGEKERDLAKQVNDELIEKVIGQQILYYPIDLKRTNFHEMYGEAVKKTFLSPIRIYALVEFTRFETEYGKLIFISIKGALKKIKTCMCARVISSCTEIVIMR